MTLEDWIIFTGFWTLFVTMPGPNAFNCIASASEFGPGIVTKSYNAWTKRV